MKSVNIVPRWRERTARDKLHDGGESKIKNEDEGAEQAASLYNKSLSLKRPEEPIARIVESKSGNMKQDGNRGSAGVQAPRSS